VKLDLTEKQVERLCINLYRQSGCDLIEFSQPHKATGQTQGIADLRVYRRAESWWHEVKRPGGTQSDHQIWFQAMVESHGEEYIIGGLNTAIRRLQKAGCGLQEIPGHT